MGALYLMTGLSGSGKTTFVNDFAEQNNIRYLCPDDFYKVYHNDGTAEGHKHEYEVWRALFDAIHIAEQDGTSVIVDTNAPTEVDRVQFLNWFPNFDKYFLIYIEADEELCRKNNQCRERIVPDNELKRMIERFKPPLDNDIEIDERWDVIIQYSNTENVLEVDTIWAKKEKDFYYYIGESWKQDD